MEQKLIRVALLDDHRVLLESLSGLLRNYPDLQIVGTASDPDEGLSLIESQKPDILLCDVEIPGRSVFEVVQDGMKTHPDLKVLFLSGFLSDVFVEHALRCRAQGYLLKGESTERIVESIRRIMQGEQCFSSEVTNRLEYDPRKKRMTVRNHSPLSTLTPRQLEVLRLLARGESVKEAAKHLHLSQKSVDSHKYRLMYKLGIHDRVQLTRLAIREGIMLP